MFSHFLSSSFCIVNTQQILILTISLLLAHLVCLHFGASPYHCAKSYARCANRARHLLRRLRLAKRAERTIHGACAACTGAGRHRLENGAGVHQVLNVLRQHRVFRLQLQIFLLYCVHTDCQVLKGVLQFKHLKSKEILF